MDRIKKNVLTDLKFYGTNALRYWKVGYKDAAKKNRTRVLVLIEVLRAR